MGFSHICCNLDLENDWGSAAYALIYGSETQIAMEIQRSFYNPVPYPEKAMIYLYPFVLVMYPLLIGGLLVLIWRISQKAVIELR
ncbi:MAG: hypothetical protein ACI4C1_01320 [Lachnospiraceae bacterium]